MRKYIEFETNLQVASFEEAMGRACSAASPEQSFAQGVYPMPLYPYDPQNPTPPEQCQWWYLQRARLFGSNAAGPGGAIRINDFDEADTFATAAPTHTLSNGASYTISLAAVKDYGDLSEAAQALFPEDAPPEE